MTLQGSRGLMLDLGDTPDSLSLQALHEALWATPWLRGPEKVFASRHGFPPPAQGTFCCPAGEVGCYTRFERDTLGYPPGWESPVILTLGLEPMESTPSHAQAVLNSLNDVFLWILAHYAPRLAVMGHSSIYHVNAEFISEYWLDLHYECLDALWLPVSHPFAPRLEGETMYKGQWVCSGPEHWQRWLTQQDEPQKYLTYKRHLSEALHTPRLRLEWE
jgi:hypothetical protein